MKENKDELELTKGQKLAGNVIAGAYLVVCGVFLLLSGLGVFGASVTVGKVAVPGVLLTVGLVFLTTAIVQRNTVSMWISFAFIVPALVAALNNFTALTYAKLYPLYIAIPAVSSLFTAIMSRSFRDHLKIIITFGLIAAVFSLQSSGLTGWNVVVPVLVVLAGLAIVYAAIRMNKSEDNDD